MSPCRKAGASPAVLAKCLTFGGEFRVHPAMPSCQVPTIKALAMQQVTGQLCSVQSATRQSASAHCVLFACHYHRIVHDVPLTTQKWPRRWCLVLHCLHHGLFNLSQASQHGATVESYRYSTHMHKRRYDLLKIQYVRQKIPFAIQKILTSKDTVLSCQKIRSSKDIIFKRYDLLKR